MIIIYSTQREKTVDISLTARFILYNDQGGITCYLLVSFQIYAGYQQRLFAIMLLSQSEDDISAIERGKSIMSYMDEIDVRLVDVPKMYLLSI